MPRANEDVSVIPSILEVARKLVSRERYQRGCIQKVGKRRKVWKLHWHVYMVQPDGTEKRRHRSKTLDCEYYSKAQAWQKLDEAIKRDCGSNIRMDDGITVESFYRNVFLPTRNWAGNTARNNEMTWKNHVAPFFGNLRLGDVRRHHIDSFYQTKFGLGISTLVQIRNAVVTVFDYAHDNEFITAIPMPKLRLKKVAKPQKEAKVLTFEQAKKVWGMKGGEHGLAYRLLLAGGLRIGELLALRWSDVGENALLIDESVETGSKIKGTKGGESREVPLPPVIRQEILQRERTGDFIFGGKKWISREAARQRWVAAARAESGVKNLDFHCIRRTCATLLKDRGYAQSKDIQAMLGHSDEATTNKHYIKPVEQSQQRAIEAFTCDLASPLGVKVVQ